MVLSPSRILAPNWALLKTCFAGRQNVLRALSVFSKAVCAPSQLAVIHGDWGGERELERERERERLSTGREAERSVRGRLREPLSPARLV